MTRLITLALITALSIFNGKSFAQVDDQIISKRVTSPSYGPSLGFLNVIYLDRNNDEQSESYVMPGIDLRHFNGINVSEGGGFYYGYELGAGLNFQSGGQQYDVLPGENRYQLENVFGFRVFLMGKHGYRFNLSDDPDGVSLGLELGLGVAGGIADIELRDLEAEGQPTYSYFEGGATPVLELGVNGAFKLNEKSRFTTRLALTLGDSFMDTGSGEIGLPGIKTEAAPVFVNLRFGFQMPYYK